MLHAAGEALDRLGVVGGVLHGLGEQVERADRGLELVADVGDEVAPYRLDAAALGLVLGEHEHLAVRAERGDAHREARALLAELPAGDLDLALPDLAVHAHPAGHRAQLRGHQLLTAHQAEGARRRAGAQHPVLAVEHHGRGRQYGEHRGDPGGQGAFGLIVGWPLPPVGAAAHRGHRQRAHQEPPECGQAGQQFVTHAAAPSPRSLAPLVLTPPRRIESCGTRVSRRPVPYPSWPGSSGRLARGREACRCTRRARSRLDGRRADRPADGPTGPLTAMFTF